MNVGGEDMEGTVTDAVLAELEEWVEHKLASARREPQRSFDPENSYWRGWILARVETYKKVLAKLHEQRGSADSHADEEDD